METLKFSTKPHLQNHFWVPQNSRILGVYNQKGHTFSFTLTCKLKTSKGKKTSKKKKISWPDSGGAPPLLKRKKAAEAITRNNNADDKVVFKKEPKRVLGVLSNLPLAIGEMFAVTGLMALGSSIIDQGKVPEFFFQNFPQDHPLFGFFSWEGIFTRGLDHMFSSPIFLGTLGLLGASLMASTTIQAPLVKVARRRSFTNAAKAIHKQEDADTLPIASVKDSGVTLMGDGYEVFLKGPALHALKGLADRFASIGVHLALLLVMSGGTLDTASILGEDVTVPQDLNSVVGDVLAPNRVLSAPSDAFSAEVHVNRIFMDYDESGEVSQFHTDISLFGLNGNEVLRKTISVNDPLRSILARDLQSIILDDKDGKFAEVKQPNSNLSIEIDGSNIVIVDTIGSSEADPGVPIVYAGFGSLMLSTCISYLSHAQLSAVQDGINVVVGGKTNRGKSESPDTTDRSVDQVEVFESSSTKESDSFIGIRIQVGIWNKKDFDM